jgi:hypothetical protein
MGWFKKQFHRATAAVAKVKNFAKPIITKVKHGWSKAGQWGGYIHNKIVPKVKTALTIASALPYIQDAAIPALGAVTVGDEYLGKALEAKAKIDKTAGRMQQYHDRIGQYHNKYKDQIKRGDVGGLIKTTGSAIKEGKKAYKTERGNFQDFKKSYAFDTKRGQDMRNHFN